jgi:hypothetical protein
MGIDINATHHRAARSGTVTATATAIQVGATLATYDIRIVDDSGRSVCTSRLTCLLRDAPPGATHRIGPEVVPRGPEASEAINGGTE